MVKVWHIATVIVLVVIGVSFYFDDDYLISRQNKLQWQIGDADVNIMLKNYIKTAKHDYYIISNYPWIKHLPGLDDHCYSMDMANDKEFFEGIRFPQVTAILITDTDIPKTVMRFIRTKLNTGEYRIIGTVEGYYLVQVK